MNINKKQNSADTSSDKKDSTKKTPVKKTIYQEAKHKFESNHTYYTICIYALCVIGLGALLIYWIMNMNQTKAAISNFINVLAPFIAAFFIAFLLTPIVAYINNVLEKYIFKKSLPKLRKGLAIFLSYAFMISLITITLLYVIPQIGTSFSDLITKLSDVEKYKALLQVIQNLETKFPDIDFGFIEEKIEELVPDLINKGTEFVANMVPLIYNVSMSIARFIINILLSIVISCYMLSDKKLLTHNFKRVCYAFIKKEKADNLLKTLGECSSIFSGFIVGKTIDSLIIGILCFIIMTILHLPYAILLSVIVGITNMIPYFGPFIGAIPGVLIYLFIHPIDAILYAFMILVLQQFDGLILGPKILGNSTGLKPLWVIFAITVGGAYFGVIGMFLGVPVVAVVSYLIDTSITKRLKEKNLDDNNFN